MENDGVGDFSLEPSSDSLDRGRPPINADVWTVSFLSKSIGFLPGMMKAADITDAQ